MTDDDSDDRTTFGDSGDLDAVSRFRADTRPADPAVLSAARARLVDHVSEPTTGPTPIGRSGGRRRSRRPVVPVLRWSAAAAVVAVIAAGAYALTDDAHHTPPTALPLRSATPSSPSVASPAPIRFVNAAQVLDAAAGADPETPLEDGRYRRVSLHSLDTGSVDEPPDRGAYEIIESRTDTWTPSSGVAYQRYEPNISVRFPTKKQRRYMQDAPGGVPKRQLYWYEIATDGAYTEVFPERQATDDGVPCQICTPDDAFWEDPNGTNPNRLPKTPTAIRSSLYDWARAQYAELVKYGKGDQFTVDDLAYDASTKTVSRSDLPAAKRAALYQTIKTIPGIELIGSLANYDGVRGVAIGRVDTFHVQHDLIFAHNGRTYIGDRTVARAPSREYRVKAGTLLGASAVSVSVTGKPDVPKR